MSQAHYLENISNDEELIYCSEQHCCWWRIGTPPSAVVRQTPESHDQPPAPASSTSITRENRIQWGIWQPCLYSRNTNKPQRKILEKARYIICFKFCQAYLTLKDYSRAWDWQRWLIDRGGLYHIKGEVVFPSIEMIVRCHLEVSSQSGNVTRGAAIVGSNCWLCPTQVHVPLKYTCLVSSRNYGLQYVGTHLQKAGQWTNYGPVELSVVWHSYFLS